MGAAERLFAHGVGRVCGGAVGEAADRIAYERTWHTNAQQQKRVLFRTCRDKHTYQPTYEVEDAEIVEYISRVY